MRFSGRLDRRRLWLVLQRWSRAASVAAGVLVALLTAKPYVARAASVLAGSIAVRIGSSSARLEPYAGFLVIFLCGLFGIAAALALRRLVARLTFSGLLPLVLVGAAEVLAFFRAPWLVPAVAVSLVATAPLLAPCTARSSPRRGNEAWAGPSCLACEAACLGLGVWFPFARTLPLYAFLGLMALPAAAAAAAGVLLLSEQMRWRIALAGLPALALPFVGMTRNPTVVPVLGCVVASVAGFLVLGLPRLEPSARCLAAWARRHAVTLAMPAATLWLLLPWRFRDMATADSNGHEGQHLGWINSMSFGKWMMADAGFTYGPLREYALAALAVVQGGVTLEHFRIAYVLLNVGGLVAMFAAMRLVCAKQFAPLVMGLALLVTHSTIAYFLIYFVNFGAFGWADAARAGLPTLAIAAAFPCEVPRSVAAVASRRRLVASGLLAAVAVLYSHDFGVPAVLATVIGISSTLLVRRGAASLRGRGQAVARSLALYAAGIALGVVPFVAVYAIGGRLGGLLHGYGWAVAVSKGATPFSWQGGAFPLNEAAFRSPLMLTMNTSDARLGTKVLDYAFGPALVVVGFGHAISALARGRFMPRSAMTLALSVFQAMLLYYAFVIPDPSHVVNSTSPGLVLLVALMAGGAGLDARVGRLVVPVGRLAALLAPALWLLDGGARVALHERLTRLAAHEERPSFGPPYRYEFARAGDEHVDDELLRRVRAITSRSGPADAVYCTTWMLGGGAEAFLSHRRNPTSFDKPDEIVSARQQAQALSELRADPPKLIVGDFFKYLS
ncbi:MAG TPA: hypothetical protein VIY73_26940, partial [Polyangiaceae bacterium]